MRPQQKCNLHKKYKNIFIFYAGRYFQFEKLLEKSDKTILFSCYNIQIRILIYIFDFLNF